MNEYEQSDLVEDLVRIFPGFAVHWAADSNGDFPSSSLHGVYLSFLSFVGSIQPSGQQWKQLADHLNKAVAAGGRWENAADTCLLEHLHQVRLSKQLRPLLSKDAQRYVRR